jgi:hypothetical protein
VKLEQQVCSLDLSKRLKELGVKQESVFCWTRSRSTKDYELSSGTCIWETADKDGHVAAFIVAELGEMLPEEISHAGMKRVLVIGKPLGDWLVSYRNAKLGKMEFKADTEADARAKMLIYLIEQGIAKP